MISKLIVAVKLLYPTNGSDRDNKITYYRGMEMIPVEIQKLIERGALFVVNHSGGKDSQAMFAYVRKFVPKEQIVVVHAILRDVEWDGIVSHIMANIDVPFYSCSARRSLLEMIAERKMFPSPSQRQCTSDLKRGPIEKVIRAVSKERGMPLIVSCMGMRAEESSSRAKLVALKLSERNSKAGREWYDWLPIHDWLVGKVFAEIEAASQKPHWAYAAGMSRLSCCFCIMSSKADLSKAAELNPGLYRKYVQLEKDIGQVMMMPSKSKGRLSLEQITGVKA